MKKRDIEILDLKQTQHGQNLAKESQEKSEMQEAISSLTLQRDERLTHRDERDRVGAAERQRAAEQSIHADIVRPPTTFTPAISRTVLLVV